MSPQFNMWCHMNAWYWHCDVIFVDYFCTHKLVQRQSSLGNVNYEYWLPTTQYSRLSIWERGSLTITKAQQCTTKLQSYALILGCFVMSLTMPDQVALSEPSIAEQNLPHHVTCHQMDTILRANGSFFGMQRASYIFQRIIKITCIEQVLLFQSIVKNTNVQI